MGTMIDPAAVKAAREFLTRQVGIWLVAAKVHGLDPEEARVSIKIALAQMVAQGFGSAQGQFLSLMSDAWAAEFGPDPKAGKA